MRPSYFFSPSKPLPQVSGYMYFLIVLRTLEKSLTCVLTHYGPEDTTNNLFDYNGHKKSITDTAWQTERCFIFEMPGLEVLCSEARIA